MLLFLRTTSAPQPTLPLSYSTLTALTHLNMSYTAVNPPDATQWQVLSNMTALRVIDYSYSGGDFWPFASTGVALAVYNTTLLPGAYQRAPTQLLSCLHRTPPAGPLPACDVA